MIKRKPRSFTLIEMLVALSLLSFVITLVFGFFLELSRLQDLELKDYEHTFFEKYSQTRLQRVFSQLTHETHQTKGSSLTIYSDEQGPSQSLVLLYNNGVRLSPILSGNLLARLYVEELSGQDPTKIEKQLCLASWPLHLKEEEVHKWMHKEILIPNIEQVQFEFWAADPKHYTKKKDKPPERGIGWLKEWKKEYKEMPLFVKMIVTKKKENDQTETKTYLFALPSTKYSLNLEG